MARGNGGPELHAVKQALGALDAFLRFHHVRNILAPRRPQQVAKQLIVAHHLAGVFPCWCHLAPQPFFDRPHRRADNPRQWLGAVVVQLLRQRFVGVVCADNASHVWPPNFVGGIRPQFGGSEPRKHFRSLHAVVGHGTEKPARVDRLGSGHPSGRSQIDRQAREGARQGSR